MGMDTVVAIVVSGALICGSIWAGTGLVKRGVRAKGATGTLGSVLSMIEPATGAPTRVEAAAAIEEMRQRRHEKLSAGPGMVHDELMSGKVVLAGRTDQKGDARI